MNFSLTPLTRALQTAYAAVGDAARRGVGARRMLITAGVAAAGAWLLIAHPPVDSVPAGEIAVRTNQFSGEVTVRCRREFVGSPADPKFAQLVPADTTWSTYCSAFAEA